MSVRALVPSLLLLVLLPFLLAASCNSALQADALTISPDGSQLATTFSRDKDVHLHDAEGNETGRLQGHTEWALAVAYSPDGTQLASAAWDGTVRLWNPATGTAIRTFADQGNTHRLDWNPQGTGLAASGRGNILEPATGETAVETGTGGGMLPMRFGPDGTTLLCGTHDGQVSVRDAMTGEEIARFGDASGSVTEMVLTRDRTLLAMVESYDRIGVWNVETRERIQQFTDGAGRAPLAWHPDGRLAMATADGVSLRDVTTGEETARIPTDTHIGAMAVSPDGRWLYTTSRNKVRRYAVPE